MDADSKIKIDSHFTILPLKTKKAFISLSQQLWVGKSGWYLAGGTALALQTGHRKSIDLDFFTTEKEFDKSEFLGNFAENNKWKTTINRKNTIYGELFKAKISFIAYPFFIPKQDFIQYGSIKILHQIDIATIDLPRINKTAQV